MLELKMYVIVIFYVVLFVSIFIYDAYMRRGGNEGVGGSLLYDEIPRGMRWMPWVASLCGLYIIGYSLIFVFHPDIQNYYFPISFLQDERISILGVVVLVIGMLIFLFSQLQLGSSYRLNIPRGNTRLVTSGLYAYSRNPLYIGLYLAFFGIFLMLPNWIYLFSLLFFIVNYHFKIIYLEEKYLLQQFGDEYREYCARVRRYI